MNKGLWTEKYRPEKLSDVLVRNEIIEDLKGFLESGSLPHLLFAGPSGSGKTMTALALARELYGDDFDQYFLSISCSDEGVMVKRKPIPGEGGGEIQKAKKRASGSGTRKRLRVREEILKHIGSPPMGDTPHKILYLLDFDSEDSQTQNALRRPMETHTDNCRFVISVENTSNIIDPLQSRCATFRFGRLSDEQTREVLRKIEKNEEVKLTDSGAKAIVQVSQGDIQKAINLFQAASTIGEEVNQDVVYEGSKAAKPEEVREIVKVALEGEFEDAREKLMNMLIEEGADPEDLLRQIQEELSDSNVPDPVKIKLVEKMGDFDFDLKEGSNERIQLEHVLAHLARIGDRLKS